MGKAVLLSIKPKWCEKILNGEKKIEIRKTKPNIEPPFKCYIYCTNNGRPLVLGDVFRGNFETEYTQTYGYSRKEAEKIWDVFNGAVAAEFTCDYITRGYPDLVDVIDAKLSCMPPKDIIAYAAGKSPYFWHISDLEVYDEPKELSEFWLYNEAWHEAYEKDDGYYVCGPDQNGEWDGCIMEDWDGKGVPPCYECWEDWNGWCHRVKRAPQSWCYVEDMK